MKRLLAAGFVAALLGPIVAALLRRRNREPAPRPLDVVCGVCYRDLHEGDAFELKVFDDELGATGEGFGDGGTYMTGYFCGQHRPPRSVPSLG